LIHLDGEYTAIRRLVSEFFNGCAKGLVDCLDPVPEQVLEPKHHGKPEAVFFAGLFDHFHHVDGCFRVLRGANFDVSFRVDREVSETPTVGVIKRDGGGDVPRFLHRSRAVVEAGGECNQRFGKF
jgi:hypothetical protein